MHSTTRAKYQSAKIIECTQNVVELRKLINDWNKLEKAKKASLNRLQQERWALEEEYSRLLGERGDSDLQESFKLEPGFRFKANGDIKKPKKKEVTKVVEYIKNWSAVKREIKNGTAEGDSGIKSPASKLEGTVDLSGVDPIQGVASENSTPYFGSSQTNEKTAGCKPTREKDSTTETMNVAKAIEETENILKEIFIAKNISRAKGSYTCGSGTFLRALSKENQYSGGPDAVKSHYEMNKALGPSE